MSLCSHLHDSWGICSLWCSRLLLDVTAASDLYLAATYSLQGLLPALLPLLHAGKRLEDGFHLPLLSCLQGVGCGVGRRGEGEVQGKESLTHRDLLIIHRAPEVEIQKVSMRYTAKAFLAVCRDKCKSAPCFHSKRNKRRAGQTEATGKCCKVVSKDDWNTKQL